MPVCLGGMQSWSSVGSARFMVLCRFFILLLMKIWVRKSGRVSKRKVSVESFDKREPNSRVIVVYLDSWLS